MIGFPKVSILKRINTNLTPNNTKPVAYDSDMLISFDIVNWLVSLWIEVQRIKYFKTLEHAKLSHTSLKALATPKR